MCGFMRVPGVPKTFISGPGKAGLTLSGDSNTDLVLSTKGKAQLAAGVHGGSTGHLHRGYGTFRKATGPAAWQGKGCASWAQRGGTSPRRKAKQLLSLSYLNLVLPTLLLSDFPGQGLFLGSELLDVHLSSAAFSLRIIFIRLNPHIIFLLPGMHKDKKKKQIGEKSL